MTDWKQVRERIEAILATIPEVVTVIEDDNCALTDADLPAVIVMNRTGVRERTLNHARRTSTRTFVLGVMAAQICGDTIEAQREAYGTAEAFMEVIPDFFARYAPNLNLSGAPLAGVFNVSDMTDDGLETRSWTNLDTVFTGFTLTFRVTLSRHF